MALIIFLGSCEFQSQKQIFHKHHESRPLFGTIIKLDACYEEKQETDIKKAFERVWQRLDEMQWRMNIFDKRSDVAKINRSHQKPVSIGADTYQLLKDSVFFSNLTKGVFDITVYPLIELWKKSEEMNKRSPPPNNFSAPAVSRIVRESI